MAPKFLGFISLVFVAETFASWGTWKGAPTDTLRVRYPSFLAFDAGRLHYWTPVFASALALWVLAWSLLRARRRTTIDLSSHQWMHSTVWWLLGASLAVGSEVMTSAFYWASPRSAHVRSLYEGLWYLDRVVPPSAVGWAGFCAYMSEHLLRWAVVFFSGFIGYFLWTRRRRRLIG